MIPVLGNQYKPSFATVPGVDPNLPHLEFPRVVEGVEHLLQFASNLRKGFQRAKPFMTEILKFCR